MGALDFPLQLSWSGVTPTSRLVALLAKYHIGRKEAAGAWQQRRGGMSEEVHDPATVGEKRTLAMGILGAYGLDAAASLREGLCACCAGLTAASPAQTGGG